MFQIEGFTGPQLFFSFIVSTLFAFISAYYAEKKGRSSLVWFVLGFLFTFIAPIALYFLSPMNEETENLKTSKNNEPSSPFKSDPTFASPQTILPPPFKEENKDENVLWFYLDQEHQQIGPVSIIALRDLWNRGLLELNSYVWTEGMQKWEKVDQLPDLKIALNKPSPL